MSWKAVEWAKTWNGELTTAEAFVLFMIAEHFNEKELRAWPSAGTLERQTRLGRSTVFRSIRKLEGKHLIEIETWMTPQGRLLSNRYCLPLYNDRSVPRPGGRVVRQEFGADGKWLTEDAEEEWVFSEADFAEGTAS
ncbi:helix-turn-helix domain-containing protein [Amnibacterium kyonggiense]|uniref:Helix-turn-helix protein n=1 Tax=Amnibacterium kyonggiense TaxID=595671 RepID=A0A4R7FGR6_9MICO|nr:helix-turn-helix domain-containing protein [Amnibacterium kyonggiense]TDS75925.1 helix-turn-helix protein [Amnibacterium kyonggiense]